MTDPATTPSIYVDANPFIYFIEGEDTIAGGLKPFFETLKDRPGLAAPSELTLAEVLPKARTDFRRSYFNLIVWSNLFHLQPITREILIDTADYRRNLMRTLEDGRKVMPSLPDAIHVVTAVHSHCRAILSADGGLKVPAGMAVYEPTEAGIANLLRKIA